jgi:hypothetical protein
MDPHTPYLPPPPFDRLFYGGDTLIVITSDHGETLNEHECYYDHHGLYESNLVTPLIIRFPGRVPEGPDIRSTSLRRISCRPSWSCWKWTPASPLTG